MFYCIALSEAGAARVTNFTHPDVSSNVWAATSVSVWSLFFYSSSLKLFNFVTPLNTFLRPVFLFHCVFFLFVRSRVMKNWAEALLSELLFDHSQKKFDENKKVPDVIILDFLLICHSQSFPSYLPPHLNFL